MIQALLEVYNRHMQMTITDISAFSNEDDIWKTAEGINNSAGNLALHIVGNLNYFIGNILGNTGYVRDRDAEFSAKGIPQKELVNLLQATNTMLSTTLSGLQDNDLNKIYPIDKFGEGKTIGYVFVYLLAHLDYHLGQINYHRRLLNK